MILRTALTMTEDQPSSLRSSRFVGWFLTTNEYGTNRQLSEQRRTEKKMLNPTISLSDNAS